MRWWLRGWLLSCSNECVGRAIILLAFLVMNVSLEGFLTDKFLKKQVEQYSTMGWMMLLYFYAAVGGDEVQCVVL